MTDHRDISSEYTQRLNDWQFRRNALALYEQYLPAEVIVSERRVLDIEAANLQALYIHLTGQAGTDNTTTTTSQTTPSAASLDDIF